MIPFTPEYHQARSKPGAKPRVLVALTTTLGRLVFSDQAPDSDMAGLAARPTAGGGWFAGGGATGPLETLDSADLVNNFGVLYDSIIANGDDLLAGLQQSTPGNITLELSNRDGRMSAIDAVHNLLAATAEFFIGYAGLSQGQYLRMFKGKIERVVINREVATIDVDAVGQSLEETLPLAKAERYTNPRTQTDVLPIPWGDLTQGGAGGVWTMPCINVADFVYALAGCPVVDQAHGQQVTIYAGDGEVMGDGFALDAAVDYEGQGLVATVAFPSISGSDISFAASDNSVNSASGAFGAWANWSITVTGSANNDGTYKVISATTTKLILDPEGRAVSDESAGSAVSIVCDQQGNEPLSVRAKGGADASGDLIENPVAVMADFLTSLARVDGGDIEPTAYTQAYEACEASGLTAAGVLLADQAPAQTLTDICACFGLSHAHNHEGRLSFSRRTGPGSMLESDICGVFRAHETGDATRTTTKSNLCNQAKLRWAFNYTTNEYEADSDGLDAADQTSQAVFGPQIREFDLPWVRAQSVALAIQAERVGAFAWPVALISVPLDSLRDAPVKPGDYCLFSSQSMLDGDRLPVANQIVQVLDVETNLDDRRQSMTLLDTGNFLQSAIYAGGGGFAGGGAGGTRRDRTEY